MRTATVRQLRHAFGSVLRWIEEGEKVEIKKKGKVVAWLTPEPVMKKTRGKSAVDFIARLKKWDGDRVIPAEAIREILDDDKGAY